MKTWQIIIIVVGFSIIVMAAEYLRVTKWQMIRSRHFTDEQKHHVESPQ